MKQEEIEWMLFELAEGNLCGEELLFWEKQIQENPEIAHLYLQLKSTYLTDSTLSNGKIYSTTEITQPLSNWGNDLIYNDKNGLKRFSQGMHFERKPYDNHDIHTRLDDSTAPLTLSKKRYSIRLGSAIAQYSTAAVIVLLGFIAWNWMYQTPSTQTKITSSSSERLQNQSSEYNSTELAKSSKQNQLSNTKSSTTQMDNLKKKRTHLVANNSEEHSKSNPTMVSNLEKSTHPLISATEDYLSTIAQASQHKNKSDYFHVQNNAELAINSHQTPVNQQFANIDETVITVVNTQPISAKSKRQFVAYNVKEMMRKGQLPNIKIQPIKEEKIGLIPPFRFELDINQVPVYQTSNHQQ